jgi:hypothetical protein
MWPFQSRNSSSVYGIVLLQIIETAADVIAAYGVNTSGWGQPDAIATIGPVNLYDIVANFPAFIDALSESRTILYWDFKCYTLQRDSLCNCISYGESSRFPGYSTPGSSK